MLAAMLGSRIRRGLQQVTTFASGCGHESDMSVALAPTSADDILELKMQQSTIRSFGWSQQSSKDSRPMTVCYGLSVAAQHKRRVLRGVLQEELEVQHRARLNLEAELTRRRDMVDDDDDEAHSKACAKAVKRAAAVPRRLTEVTRRGEHLEALLERSRGATDDASVDDLYHEVGADGLADRLETFDV